MAVLGLRPRLTADCLLFTALCPVHSGLKKTTVYPSLYASFRKQNCQ